MHEVFFQVVEPALVLIHGSRHGVLFFFPPRFHLFCQLVQLVLLVLLVVDVAAIDVVVATAVAADVLLILFTATSVQTLVTARAQPASPETKARAFVVPAVSVTVPPASAATACTTLVLHLPFFPFFFGPGQSFFLLVFGLGLAVVLSVTKVRV